MLIDGLPIVRKQAVARGDVPESKSDRERYCDRSAMGRSKEPAKIHFACACWSLPILNTKGEVIASFAAYYKTPKAPADEPELLIGRRIWIQQQWRTTARKKEGISRDRYMLAARATNDAIWDWDLHTGGYFWGRRVLPAVMICSVLVKTRKFWEDHIHPEDRERIIRDMSRFIQQKDKGLWLEEYRFKRSDGKYALISDRGFLVFGKEKKILRMIGCIQDITEKER